MLRCRGGMCVDDRDDGGRARRFAPMHDSNDDDKVDVRLLGRNFLSSILKT